MKLTITGEAPKDSFLIPQDLTVKLDGVSIGPWLSGLTLVADTDSDGEPVTVTLTVHPDSVDIDGEALRTLLLMAAK